MRKRRPKRYIEQLHTFNMPDLKTISHILYICIIILLVIFIFSSIHSKKQLLKQLKSANTVAKIAESDNSSIIQDVQNNTNINETQNTTTYNSESTDTKKTVSKDTTINMAFTGDIMCPSTIFNDAYNQTTSTYDFSYIFENVKYHLQTPDITIGNLETTFSGAGQKYSNYPKSNAPESLAYLLKKIGFDVISTANSHSYDYNYSGIESTIKFLNSADLSHTGTYTSEAEQQTILVKSVKGIKIAFLSFSSDTNGNVIPNDRTYSINLSDEGTIMKQLTLAKEQNPDLICVNINWGTEYQVSPNSNQNQLADLLFKNGADIIIGNHPHVLQPMEKRNITLENGSTKTGFLVYSLGNFLADQQNQYAKTSVILNLNITKHEDNTVNINTVTYTPIYINKDSTATTHKFKLLDIKNMVSSYEAGYTDGISDQMYTTLSNELNNVKRLLGSTIN